MILIRRIVGMSMWPAFRPGTLVIAWRYREPRAGDVVIATKKGREIIKRIARQGDMGYFLVGDNAEASTDSRVFGWVAPQSIKGVVIGALQ